MQTARAGSDRCTFILLTPLWVLLILDLFVLFDVYFLHASASHRSEVDALAVFHSLALDEAEVAVHLTQKSVLRGADVNGDGMVSLDEAAHLGRLRGTWAGWLRYGTLGIASVALLIFFTIAGMYTGVGLSMVAFDWFGFKKSDRGGLGVSATYLNTLCSGALLGLIFGGGAGWAFTSGVINVVPFPYPETFVLAVGTLASLALITRTMRHVAPPAISPFSPAPAAATNLKAKNVSTSQSKRRKRVISKKSILRPGSDTA